MNKVSDTVHIKKILLNGYYGFDNFGDELILSILIQELKKLGSIFDIVVLSSNPDKTSALYGVRSFNRMDFLQIIREMSSAHAFIYGGGSLFQDVTSSLSIFYYIFLLILGQLFGLKTVLLAQGIGPINRKIVKQLFRFVLKKVDLITVRDVESYNFLSDMNINLKKTNDLAWVGLDDNSCIVDSVGGKYIELLNGGKYLVVNLRQWYSMDDQCIKNLARAVIEVAEINNLAILILPVHLSYDLSISKKLFDMISSTGIKDNVFLLKEECSIRCLNSILKSCSFLISMRYHPLLVAIESNIPVFGISYDPKVKYLMESMGLKYVDVPELLRKDLNVELLNIFRCSVNFDNQLIKLAKDESKINLNMLLENL